MARPVVFATNGYGRPVTIAENGFGEPVVEAENGLGEPVVLVEKGGAPVVFSGASIPSSENKYLIDAITDAGLASGLQICLDAGDADSYTSGQKWLDRSGNGQDFFLGASGTATTDDPAFNGVAGGKSSSEYFSFDGGDKFQYDTTNEAWMQTLHKDNAKFAACGWVYRPAGDSALQMGLFGTRSAEGVACLLTNTTGLGISLIVGSGVLESTQNGVYSLGKWTFWGVSLDEAVGTDGLIFFVDGTAYKKSSTYTTPGTGNASQVLSVGGTGSTLNRMPSGSRMAQFAMWNGVALTETNFNAIYNATKGRFE